MKENPHGRYQMANPEILSTEGSHGKVLAWVPPAKTILEFGPGPATMTRHLKRMGETLVVVEADPGFAAQCRNYADTVIEGDIEDPATWDKLLSLGHRYDRVIFSDVLEHLKDPWAVLKRVREILSPNGTVLASIPNVAHWSIRAGLFIGRFNYVEEGLLDRTHIRFFTLKTVRELFARSGYKVTRMDATVRNDFFFPFQIVGALLVAKPIEILIKWLFPNLVDYQFIIEASPNRS